MPVIGLADGKLGIDARRPPAIRHRRFGASRFSVPTRRQTFGEGAWAGLGQCGKMPNTTQSTTPHGHGHNDVRTLNLAEHWSRSRNVAISNWRDKAKPYNTRLGIKCPSLLGLTYQVYFSSQEIRPIWPISLFLFFQLCCQC